MREAHRHRQRLQVSQRLAHTADILRRSCFFSRLVVGEAFSSCRSVRRPMIQLDRALLSYFHTAFPGTSRAVTRGGARPPSPSAGCPHCSRSAATPRRRRVNPAKEMACRKARSVFTEISFPISPCMARETPAPAQGEGERATIWRARGDRKPILVAEQASASLTRHGVVALIKTLKQAPRQT